MPKADVVFKKEIMKYEIPSKKVYHETVVSVYDLMNKGETNLTPSELKILSAMSVAAEKYEDEILNLKPKIAGILPD
jgi:hypothetical protein